MHFSLPMKFQSLLKEFQIGKPMKPTKWSKNPNRTTLPCFFLFLSILLLSILFSILHIFFINSRKSTPLIESSSADQELTWDFCSGRYIYVHQLPDRFNRDLLENCQSLTRASDKSSMCDSILNSGLGPRIPSPSGVLSNESWYYTNQFLLEVIFHNRMNKYECLTNDSSLASAIFVPFYAGLDLRRHLWGFSTSVRDSSGIDLINWLTERPEWRKMQGRDHFLVAGRISRDFRRNSDRNSDWGSNFRLLPESDKMSMLSIESGSWTNDFAIPYPTNFHPAKDMEVSQWQDRMRLQHRPYLFSFAGAARSRVFVRALIINQCIDSAATCKFLDCDSEGVNCDDPTVLMKLFQSSVFCLQPPGDSFTRRSTFDSILGGCIPVFFHPRSAYTQYKLHLPTNPRKYSVFISPKELRLGKMKINETLMGLSREEFVEMREEVIRLIPRVVYADPRSRLEAIEDAFDLAVKGILQRIEGIGDQFTTPSDGK